MEGTRTRVYDLSPFGIQSDLKPLTVLQYILAFRTYKAVALEFYCLYEYEYSTPKSELFGPPGTVSCQKISPHFP